jgi:hypothetical protein
MDRRNHRFAAAMAIEKKKAEQQPTPESKEGKEQFEKQKAFVGAALQWVEALRNAPQIADLPIPESKKLGAVLIPTLAFTTLMGCADSLTTIECSAEQDAFLQASAQWIDENPERIEQLMSESWPDITITGQNIADTLMTAEVVCGIDKNDSSLAGSANLRKNVITVDVSADHFETHLDGFLRGEWTSNESMELLAKEIRAAECFEEADEIIHDTYDYFFAVEYAAMVLAHEAAHLVEDQVHSKEVSTLVNSDEFESMSDEEKMAIDVFYGWGIAAKYAVRDYVDEIITPVNKAHSERYLDHIDQ